jgi:hypothetical protein
MNLAPATMFRAVLLVGRDVHVPLPDEPGVEIHLIGTVRRRMIGVEHVDE